MSTVIESKDFWKQQLERFKMSGLSRSQFCRENSVNYERFGYWIKKLCPTSSIPFISVEIKKSDAKDNMTLCTIEMRGHILKIHDLSALSFLLGRLV